MREAKLTGEVGSTSNVRVNTLRDNVTFCTKECDILCMFGKVIEFLNIDLLSSDGEECNRREELQSKGQIGNLLSTLGSLLERCTCIQ